MQDWKCAKCNVAVEECEIAIHYGDMELPAASGYRCPVCHAQYIPSEFVVEELNPAEQMLEGK
ncbi:MAG: DUF7479 domain-containing protein [Candidatus Limivicinus sp.]